MTSRMTERLMRIFNSHEYEIVLMDGHELAQIEYEKKMVTGYPLKIGDKIEVQIHCQGGDYGRLTLPVEGFANSTRGPQKVFVNRMEIRHLDTKPQNPQSPLERRAG